MTGDNFQSGLDHIEKVWREFMPDRLFEFTMMSERYRNLYRGEGNQSQLFTSFAMLAIFIACLALFSLATFNTLQRVKEIGILKVLGCLGTGYSYATFAGNHTSCSGCQCVGLARCLVLYGQMAWGLAYRIDINPSLFVLATGITILIALLTVSSQTIKAAVTCFSWVAYRRVNR